MRPHLVSTVTWFALALTTVAVPQAQSQPTAATAGSTLPYVYSNPIVPLSLDIRCGWQFPPVLNLYLH